MKVLKGYVRNRAKPEGCIAEGYLADECISFVSEFIEGARDLDNNRMRNEEFLVKNSLFIPKVKKQKLKGK